MERRPAPGVLLPGGAVVDPPPQGGRGLELAWIMHHEGAKARRGLRTNRLSVLVFGAAVTQLGRLPASQQRWCPLRPSVLRPSVSWRLCGL